MRKIDNYHQPKINVIIAAYNASQFIAQTLDSILAQTYKNFMVLCVNDGSTDSTLKIINEYCKKDPRIKVATIKHSGAALARNYGLDYLKDKYPSDYTMILDADDIFLSKMFERLIRKAVKDDADVTVGNYDFLSNKNGNIEKKYTFYTFKYLPKFRSSFKSCELRSSIFMFTIGWAWDKLFKTSLIDKYNIRFQNIDKHNDCFFVHKALMHSQKISIVDRILVHYRTDVESSITRNTTIDQQKCNLDVVRAVKQELMQSYDECTHDNLFKVYERSFIVWACDYIIFISKHNYKEICEKFDMYKKIYINELNMDKYSKRFLSLSRRIYKTYHYIMTSQYNKAIRSYYSRWEWQRIFYSLIKRVPLLKKIYFRIKTN